jgi:hypothetical protein
MCPGQLFFVFAACSQQGLKRNYLAYLPDNCVPTAKN